MGRGLVMRLGPPCAEKEEGGGEAGGGPGGGTNGKLGLLRNTPPRGGAALNVEPAPVTGGK